MSSGLIWSFGPILFLCAFFVIRSMIKTGHPIKAFIVSAIQGITLLFALNVISSLTHVTLSVNTVTMIVSGVLGVPGVIMLLILRLLL